MVFLMANDVLPQETFVEVSRIMLQEAFQASYEYNDLEFDDGTVVSRPRCTAPRIIKKLKAALGLQIDSLIPGYSDAEAERECPAHICWNTDEEDPLDTHLDGNPGDDGFVAIYSVGAKGTLWVRTIPGDGGNTKMHWVEVVIEPNCLYVLDGYRHMHSANTHGGRRGVLVMALGRNLWPMPSSLSSPTSLSSHPTLAAPPSSSLSSSSSPPRGAPSRTGTNTTEDPESEFDEEENLVQKKEPLKVPSRSCLFV